MSVLFMDASQAPRMLPSSEQVPSRDAEWKPRLRNVSETHVSRVWDGNPELAAEPKPDDVERAWKTTPFTDFHIWVNQVTPSKCLGGGTPICWDLGSEFDTAVFCANRPYCSWAGNTPTKGGTWLESVSPRPPFPLYWWE